MRSIFACAVVAARLLVAAGARAAGPVLLDERALVGRLAEQVVTQYDQPRGGWVTRDGRPIEGAMELALALARGPHGETWRTRALATLDWTWSLFDTVGGGFLTRGGTAVPERMAFDKSTRENARRLELLLDAWQLTRDPLYRQRAARTADFMDRVLADGRGGFVAGQVGDREPVGEANGVGIHAWLRWAAAENRTAARDFALRSLDRVRAACWDTTFGMLRHGTFGEIQGPPQLADQVEMGRAYLLSAHLCGRAADLAMARALATHVLNEYEDREKGGFMTQAAPDKKGRIKHAARLPDENARAALFLAELASVSGDGRYRTAARRTIAAFAKEHEKPQPETGDWALAARAVEVADLPDRPSWAEPKPRPRSVTVPPARRRYR